MGQYIGIGRLSLGHTLGMRTFPLRTINRHVTCGKGVRILFLIFYTFAKEQDNAKGASTQ